MPIWLRTIPLIFVLFFCYVMDLEYLSEYIMDTVLFLLFSHWYLIYVGIQFLTEDLYTDSTEMAYIFFAAAIVSFLWSVFRIKRRKFYKTDAGKEYLREKEEKRIWESETAEKIRFIRNEWFKP